MLQARRIPSFALLFAAALSAGCDEEQAKLCDAVCVVGERSLAVGSSACDPASAANKLLCVPGADGCPILAVQACGAPESCAEGADGAVCCQNECTPGERRCLLGGVATCGNYDSDPCFELGDIVPCGDGESCLGGACCAHECDEGARRCAGDGKEQRCGYFDADACRDWGPQTACAGGTTCRGGSCCADDCFTDAAECAGDDARRVCGQFDDDACLDWKALPCPAGQRCHGGACCQDTCAADACDSSTEVRPCVVGASGCRSFSSTKVACPPGQTCNAGVCCTVECQVGAVRCSADRRSVEQCGNYDADPCPEWGPAETCAPAEVCKTASTSFPATQCCVDECTEGIGVCAGPLLRACGDFDRADPCLELSPVATSCEGGGACTEGVCNRCGDGVPRGGEACDDGDSDPSDGCHNCQVMAVCPSDAAHVLNDTGSGACYAYFAQSMAWAGAVADCAARGGALTSVADASENARIASLGLDAQSEPALAWIGLSDGTSEGEYTWVDGKPFVYANWNGVLGFEEPSGAGAPDQDCAGIWLFAAGPGHTRGAWADLACDDAGVAGYVCKFVPPR